MADLDGEVGQTDAEVRHLLKLAERLSRLARMAAMAMPPEAQKIRSDIAETASVLRKTKPRVMLRMASLRTAVEQRGR